MTSSMVDELESKLSNSIPEDPEKALATKTGIVDPKMAWEIESSENLDKVTDNTSEEEDISKDKESTEPDSIPKETPLVEKDSNVIVNTIKELEGFADNSYYDVNAERSGFGSDTKTDPKTGKVTRITKGMTVTKEEAEADLNRRLPTEFIPSVINAVGKLKRR